MLCLDDIDVSSVEVTNIYSWDYPDFCDAYVQYAETKDGCVLDDSELDFVNDNSDFVYECVWYSLYGA